MQDDMKVICPWCGKEMTLGEDLPFSGIYAYVCKCGAVSPNKCGKENALKAALARPLQKPLTLEDFKQSMHTPVWFESRGTYKGHKGWWMIPQRIQDKSNIVYYVDELSESNSFLGLSAYGSVWRAWATKPTDEERSAAGWDE